GVLVKQNLPVCHARGKMLLMCWATRHLPLIPGCSDCFPSLRRGQFGVWSAPIHRRFGIVGLPRRHWHTPNYQSAAESAHSKRPPPNPGMARIAAIRYDVALVPGLGQRIVDGVGDAAGQSGMKGKESGRGVATAEMLPVPRTSVSGATGSCEPLSTV